tara:strand:- start:96 stop:257 length:162 start_codon:yes stop_codon:yes gene_type:complete
MSWFKKLIKFITPPSMYTEVRARDVKGKYVADNPSTPNINEAYKKVRKKKTKK